VGSRGVVLKLVSKKLGEELEAEKKESSTVRKQKINTTCLGSLTVNRAEVCDEMRRAVFSRSARSPYEIAVRETFRAQSFHSSRLLRQGERTKQQDPSISTATNTGTEQSDASEKQERANIVAQLRSSFSQKRTELEPIVKKRLEELGKRWNEYSGYEEVLDAKAQTLEAELHLKKLRDQQSKVREGYMSAIQARSASQKTLNDLLSRRSNWSDTDISTYTQLLRSEHSEAKAEREAGEQYETIERKVNSAWDDVVKKTLERYHLEQLWSDRVRAGSTYGGLIAAGLNG
jgi:hypothetical protein